MRITTRRDERGSTSLLHPMPSYATAGASQPQVHEGGNTRRMTGHPLDQRPACVNQSHAKASTSPDQRRRAKQHKGIRRHRHHGVGRQAVTPNQKCRSCTQTIGQPRLHAIQAHQTRSTPEWTKGTHQGSAMQTKEHAARHREIFHLGADPGHIQKA